MKGKIRREGGLRGTRASAPWSAARTSCAQAHRGARVHGRHIRGLVLPVGPWALAAEASRGSPTSPVPARTPRSPCRPQPPSHHAAVGERRRQQEYIVDSPLVGACQVSGRLQKFVGLCRGGQGQGQGQGRGRGESSRGLGGGASQAGAHSGAHAGAAAATQAGAPAGGSSAALGHGSARGGARRRCAAPTPAGLPAHLQTHRLQPPPSLARSTQMRSGPACKASPGWVEWLGCMPPALLFNRCISSVIGTGEAGPSLQACMTHSPTAWLRLCRHGTRYPPACLELHARASQSRPE